MRPMLPALGRLILRKAEPCAAKERHLMAFTGFSLSGRKGATGSRLKAFEDADDDVEAAVPSLTPQQLQDQGNQAAAGGDWGLALHRWDEALAAHPANAHILHEQKAQVYLEIGDPWRAIQSATAATQLQPGWAEGHLTLARAQLNLGEPEMALQGLDTVLRLEPGHAEASEEINTVRMLVMQRRQQWQQQGGGTEGAAPAGGAASRLRVVSRRQQEQQQGQQGGGQQGKAMHE